MAVTQVCHMALLKGHHTEKGVVLSQIMISLQTDLNFSGGNTGRTIPRKNYSCMVPGIGQAMLFIKIIKLVLSIPLSVPNHLGPVRGTQTVRKRL